MTIATAGRGRSMVRWSVAVLAAVAAVLLFGVRAGAQSDENLGPPPKYQVAVPSSMPIGVPIQIDAAQLPDANRNATAQLQVGGTNYALEFERGVATASDIVVESGGDTTITVLENGSAVPFTDEAAPVGGPSAGEIEAITDTSVDVLVPGFMTIVPAVLAIGLALAFKKVLPALFGGVWLAAWISTGYSITGLWTSLLRVFDTYILNAIAPPDGDPGHMSVVLFTFFIGGTVGIITRNGGTKGLVEKFTGIATTPQQAQAATGALGVGIFFGGYTSSLIVGNAMRPVTDHFNISREKLAYSVDSTASPIATLMIVSTWVGYQVGLIEDAIGKVSGINANAYAVFLRSIPYSFYAFMAIFMVFLIAYTSRDYGPMLKAEVRARRGQVQSNAAQQDDQDAQQEAGSEAQDLVPKEGSPARLINAAGPIGVLIIGVVVALLLTGEGSTLWERVGSADSTKALIWSSSIAMLTAIVMTLGQRILTLSETIDAWFAGVKSVLFVLFILTMAWALSSATNDLHTGPFLANLLGDTLPPWIMPAAIFALAAGIAFSIGTSWGTMGILTPLVVPLAFTVLSNNDMLGGGGELHPIFLASIAAVLGGAVWGDHCSPISDTTIISALSSGCEVIEHTRTQLPYAFLSAGAGVVLGHIPVGFGVPWWIAIPLCAIGVTAFMYIFGKKADEIDEEFDDDVPAEEAVKEYKGDGVVEDVRESVMALIGRSDTEDDTSSTRFGL
jgi:Na+/H+ antiporter NhaC